MCVCVTIRGSSEDEMSGLIDKGKLDGDFLSESKQE